MGRMNPFDLSGRVVLLTGAAGHLGHAMGRAILEAGGELVMVGRREDALAKLKDSFPAPLRAHCHVLARDVTHANTPAFLKREIDKRFGRLHGIVNNAYAGTAGTLEAVRAEDFAKATAYNLIAPFTLVQAFAPLLEATAKREKSSVSVVNVASMYGIVSPDPSIYGDSGKNNPAHYGATKAGMIQLTRYLACHLGSCEIRVNSVSPGPFPDPATDSGIPRFHDKLARKVPMGRIGKPHEVAGPVVFLLSEAASYVNGADLRIDGGWTAW
jgi:NAD(P)-dependent dehydrogenase (short-subunit alcohol dehydrogenase family)